MTHDVLGKLEQAFSIGCTDEEACIYADIKPDNLYEYCRKNPEFSKRKEQLKRKPILKAKNTIISNLDDPKIAQWYLERKSKEEFSSRQELSVEGEAIQPVFVLQEVEANDPDNPDQTGEKA